MGNKKKEESKIQEQEMKFLRRVKSCTKRDRIRNRDIKTELNIFNVNEKIIEYMMKWKEHVERMDENKLPARVLQILSKRKRGQTEKKMGTVTGKVPNTCSEEDDL